MSVLKHELTARDIMSVDPICVRPHTTIRELARTFEEHEISGAPVIDQSGKVVGVVTKTDLIRRCSEGTADIPPAYLFEVLSDQGDDEEQHHHHGERRGPAGCGRSAGRPSAHDRPQVGQAPLLVSLRTRTISRRLRVTFASAAARPAIPGAAPPRPASRGGRPA